MGDFFKISFPYQMLKNSTCCVKHVMLYYVTLLRIVDAIQLDNNVFFKQQKCYLKGYAIPSIELIKTAYIYNFTRKVWH